MKLHRINLKGFKRFTELEINNLPADARLVVLAGPNGCGKSSLFDAFHSWRRNNGGLGHSWDKTYHAKQGINEVPWNSAVDVVFHNAQPTTPEQRRKAFYFRSAYRNEADFSLSQLDAVKPSIDEIRFARLIDNDSAVSSNYRRLSSQALEDVFENEAEGTTIKEFREKTIGRIQASFGRVFPDVKLNSLGNPLKDGTFRFAKGVSDNFLYKNLSGGEKASFDLISDLVIKLREFDDTVFCIDEPEVHMNTRLQGDLLEELYSLVPENSQLWISTHSIGMLRRARDLNEKFPGTVVFLDFGNVDFDHPQVLEPIKPNRAFWEDCLKVALDDLSDLVAPSRVVICEGTPSSGTGKNSGHDERCYNAIFAHEFPETRFLSAGNSNDVKGDRLALVGAIRALAKGAEVVRLVDKDDHSQEEIQERLNEGVRVLSRRHLECYLFDDEILTALCAQAGKPEEAPALLAEKCQAIQACVAQGKPEDDIKSAAGMIYTSAKQRLQLRDCGNDAKAFQRDTLCKLIVPAMATYQQLRQDIFGG